jgi:hypothetical protein
MLGLRVAISVAVVAAAAGTAALNPLPEDRHVPAIPYERSLYKHWVDADGDCQNTRQEVLIAESIVPVTFADGRRCTVLSGEWHDPYTGQVFTDPRKLDVDHMVPLAEAHNSGGYGWDAKRRQAFANDLSHPDTLIAVSLSANRAKGDKDPARWLPANAAFRCTYVVEWLDVKKRWDLAIDRAERSEIDNVLADCDATPLVSVPLPRPRPGPIVTAWRWPFG